MKEIYKDIIGYENCYQISNMGNVKSVERIINGRHGKTKIKCKILKQSNSRGYPSVNIYKSGKLFNAKIHRLIGLHFIPNPNNKKCLNHINGIKTDNRIDNLEWVTHSENIIHAYKNKLKKNEKIIYQYDLNGKFISSFDSLSLASKSINKYECRGNISYCCQGLRKSAFGYKWEYKN